MCTNIIYKYIGFPFVTHSHFAEYLEEPLLFYTHTNYVYKNKCTCDTLIVSLLHIDTQKVSILLIVLKASLGTVCVRI